jgi:fatty-acid peroxygenase
MKPDLRSRLPALPAPDSTAAFLRDGYRFAGLRCAEQDTDVFETRLLGEPAVCLRGREGAELFYDTSRFERADAFPPRVLRTLLGEGGVQGLDGAAHRDRKALFLRLIGPESGAAEEVAARFTAHWREALPGWGRAGEVVLHRDLPPLLYRAAADWAGLPDAGTAATRRATDRMLAMIDAPAAVGPRYLRSRQARTTSERELAGLVRGVRERTAEVPEGSPADRIARYRDGGGALLSERVAAVELLNLLRPVVAVERFVVFAALLLHRFPEWAARLGAGEPGGGGEEEEVGCFVQEVRRLTPFFPMVAARVRRDAGFTWRGVDFPGGRRVLLDLYGTDRHPGLWPDADRFAPDRFHGPAEPDPYALVPQGGGDHAMGHRCPGEGITLALMRAAVRILTREIAYRVPEQDLRVNLRRIPALPRSGVILTDVLQVPDESF